MATVFRLHGRQWQLTEAGRGKMEWAQLCPKWFLKTGEGFFFPMRKDIHSAVAVLALFILIKIIGTLLEENQDSGHEVTTSIKIQFGSMKKGDEICQNQFYDTASEAVKFSTTVFALKLCPSFLV